MHVQSHMAVGQRHWQNAADELRDRGSAMRLRLLGRMQVWFHFFGHAQPALRASLFFSPYLMQMLQRG